MQRFSRHWGRGGEGVTAVHAGKHEKGEEGENEKNAKGGLKEGLFQSGRLCALCPTARQLDTEASSVQTSFVWIKEIGKVTDKDMYVRTREGRGDCISSSVAT